MFKRYEICSKLTINKPEQRRSRFTVFIVNIEIVPHLFLVSVLLNLNSEIFGWWSVFAKITDRILYF